MTDVAFYEVRSSARAWAPDHYFTALLAPRGAQADLVALAAFLGDVERIVATVSEPALAEIRLQWWRDAIFGAAQGELTGHPLADALGAAIRRHGLPVAEFAGLIEARTGDLYADPIADEQALGMYFHHTDGAAFRLAARCLGSQVWGVNLVQHTKHAYGITRLIRTLPVALARGRMPLPGVDYDNSARMQEGLRRWHQTARDRLVLGRAIWRHSPLPERAACLPLALVAPYLEAIGRPGHDPARMVADIAPLTRLWRLWLAHVTGRC